MHSRSLMHTLFGSGAAGIPAWALAAGAVGCVLWAAAYLLVITTCFRQKTYGIPLAAICMNITWEILSVFTWEVTEPAFHYADIAWLSMDLVIISQLLLYGRAEQTIEPVRRHFYPVVFGTLVLAYVGQYTFAETYRDVEGFVLAFVINMGMSILFVFMFMMRPNGRGLPMSVAWLKMLGTALESVMCVAWMPVKHPEIEHFGFLYFLYLTTFLFDGIYVGQLWYARRARAVTAKPAPAGSPVADGVVG